VLAPVQWCLGSVLRRTTIEGSLSAVVLLCGGLVFSSAYWGGADFPALGGGALVLQVLGVAVLGLGGYIGLVLPLRPKLVLGSYGRWGLTEAPRAPEQSLRGDLRCRGRWFVDGEGRTLLLRGLNLSGACKLPTDPDGATYRSDGSFFTRTRDVSFVGRPFPLEEADEHLSRIRSWGLTFVRLLITWEAVEHAGPGQYDEEYLAYLLAVVRKCADHGITVFIDPHQDVWSRWTGGDGAPAWTLEAVGFALNKIDRAGAAVTHQVHGDPFPKMIWGLNYQRLACATMFTLFWAGDDLAPATRVLDPALGEEVSAQEFLQGHFIAAMRRVAQVVAGEKNVVGFDSLNEPSPGWVGRRASLTDWGMPFLQGHILSPVESMFAGSGHPVYCDVYSEPFVFSRRDLVNPDGVSCWQEGKDCVWKANGVWDEGVDCWGRAYPRVLKPDHFSKKPDGQSIDFTRDYQTPFLRRIKSALQEACPGSLLFCESVVDFELEGALHPPRTLSDRETEGVVWAAHHYDVLTLMTKRFRTWFAIDMAAWIKHPVFGKAAVVGALARMLEHVQGLAEEVGAHGVPTLIGEIGIPFDMEPHKYAYRTKDFSLETLAMDTNMQALERTLASFTLWNYCPINTNDRGDLWNDEDLSVFSQDQRDDPKDLNSGGRALAALVRPYATRVSGTPVSMHFDFRAPDRRFTFSFLHRADGPTAPTILYVPQYQYLSPDRLNVGISDGSFEVQWEDQTLVYTHDPQHSGMHTITLRLQ